MGCDEETRKAVLNDARVALNSERVAAWDKYRKDCDASAKEREAALSAAEQKYRAIKERVESFGPLPCCPYFTPRREKVHPFESVKECPACGADLVKDRPGRRYTTTRYENGNLRQRCQHCDFTWPEQPKNT